MENRPPRPSVHETNFDYVRAAARRSTCIRRAVGCVIVDADNHVLSTGYNGVARGSVHCIDSPCLGSRDQAGNNRNCEAIHSEANALMWCSEKRFAAVMYCSCTPCFDCCKLILTTAIKKIIVLEEYADRTGLNLLKAAGVKLYRWQPQLEGYQEQLIEL